MAGATTIDYALRAGNRAMPPDWRSPLPEVSHSRDQWEAFLAGHAELSLGAAVRQFYADISEFQRPVNSHYPYPMLAFRADSGWRLDNNARLNKAYVDAHPDHILVAPIYNVFIPGQTGAILKRLKGLFGSECPPPYCPMTDMEQGAGFAGPGNHSSEVNDFVAELAAWSSQARQIGYANAPDWSANWPSRPSWMKRSIALYSSGPTPAGYYARQYYGALPYAVPAGYPTACAPFGSYVDMNVVPRSTGTIRDDFGLDWLSMATKAEVQAACKAAVEAAIPDIVNALLDHNIVSINSATGAKYPLERFLQSPDRRTLQILNAVTAHAQATLDPAQFAEFQKARDAKA